MGRAACFAGVRGRRARAKARAGITLREIGITKLRILGTMWQ